MLAHLESVFRISNDPALTNEESMNMNQFEDADEEDGDGDYEDEDEDGLNPT